MRLKDLAVVGQGHPAGNREGRREAQRQALGDGTPSGKDQVQGVLGNEGVLRVGRRAAKARVLVSHLCGAEVRHGAWPKLSGGAGEPGAENEGK